MSAPSNPTRRALMMLWRGRVGVVAALLALVLPPTMAGAETGITTQATADNGAFLPYAPAPAQLAGLCLVDTGVNLNPDTEGVVVERTALDGGSGNDVSSTLHGTVLAMMAGAPANSWGMVGTAPHAIQIVSVRILEPEQTTFPFSAYATGIVACLSLRSHYNIRVINLSLGTSESPSAESYEALANAVERATNYGVAVVAAAGNDDGGGVEYPAAYPSVLSVGATDTQGGGFCSFSNRGEGLRLLAPGCDLDGADPATGEPDYNYWQGTSEASAIAAAALDALDSYQPGLSPEAGEKDLTEADSGTLDIAQTFRNAGLGAIVTAGEAAEPGAQSNAAPASSPQPVSPLAAMTFTQPFGRPRARLRRVKHRFVLALSGRPSEAQVQVRYLGHRGRSRRLRVLRTLHGVFTSLTLPSSGVVEVSVRYTDPYDVERASPWTTLRLPASANTTGKATRAR
ncbi:MAG TPA: S8 family serine peptidase [Solirubrobacteraceae bacterium]|nr:S8 family serine peptidase [Solirubrobacteraceae bacterium]